MYGTFHRVVLQPYAQVGYSPFYIIYSCYYDPINMHVHDALYCSTQ